MVYKELLQWLEQGTITLYHGNSKRHCQMQMLPEVDTSVTGTGAHNKGQYKQYLEHVCTLSRNVFHNNKKITTQMQLGDLATMSSGQNY